MKKLISLALILLPLTASALNFKFSGITLEYPDSKMYLYYDIEGPEVTEYTVKVWIKSIKSNGTNVATLETYDCKDKTVSIEVIVLFDKLGNIEDVTPVSMRWEKASDVAGRDILLNKFCKTLESVK